MWAKEGKKQKRKKENKENIWWIIIALIIWRHGTKILLYHFFSRKKIVSEHFQEYQKVRFNDVWYKRHSGKKKEICKAAFKGIKRKYFHWMKVEKKINNKFSSQTDIFFKLIFLRQPTNHASKAPFPTTITLRCWTICLFVKTQTH